MNKCQHCPLRDEARDCPGQRNARACERADPASPDHDPGIIRQILNFAGAVIGHVAAGRPKATPAQKADRLGTCQVCDQYDGGSCRLCGCGLSLKASWADQACPLGKWLAITPDASSGPSE